VDIVSAAALLGGNICLRSAAPAANYRASAHFLTIYYRAARRRAATARTLSA